LVTGGGGGGEMRDVDWVERSAEDAEPLHRPECTRSECTRRACERRVADSFPSDTAS
jgi:hypothetical protein